jgi:D-alanyl-D-alanine carboxypeptidase (penicillin-binding protein 5/6)
VTASASRRRPVVLAAILAVLVLLVGYVLGTQLAALPSAAAHVHADSSLTRPAAQLAWPSFGSAAVAPSEGAAPSR